MESLGNILQVGGAVVMFSGFVWALCQAFRHSVLLGVVCLLFTLALLCFLIVRIEEETWKPLLAIACGLGAFLGGSAIVGQLPFN
jgi:hypothetical protein